MAVLVRELRLEPGEEESRWVFRWVSDAAWGEPNKAEWRAALEALKAVVPPEARSYDPETHLWHVAEVFADDLAGIFANWIAEVDALGAQGSLFDEAPTTIGPDW